MLTDFKKRTHGLGEVGGGTWSEGNPLGGSGGRRRGGRNVTRASIVLSV